MLDNGGRLFISGQDTPGKLLTRQAAMEHRLRKHFLPIIKRLHL
jgi:hypothetical protein